VRTLLISPSILADLKPHQIEGVSFLQYLRRNNAHGILGDEMGLGKTLQVLSFFQQLVNVEVNDKRPFLVVCPLSVLSSWMSETAKWTRLRAIQYYGSQEKRKQIAKVISQKGNSPSLSRIRKANLWLQTPM
jgi:SWI/SNF-related matrix-associated actin-dependent regulator of chromatin subfamily A member 5